MCPHFGRLASITEKADGPPRLLMVIKTMFNGFADWQLKHRGDGLALRRFHGNIAVAVLVHIVSIDFCNERIEIAPLRRSWHHPSLNGLAPLELYFGIA